MPKYIPFNEHKTNNIYPVQPYLNEVGDFNITTNIDNTVNSSLNQKTKTSLIYSHNIGTKKPVLKTNELKLDWRKVSNYIKFRSFEQSILYSIEYIVKQFPASLYITDNISGKIGNNLLNVSYNSFTNKTQFIINTNFISNPLDVNFLNKPLPLDETYSKYRDLIEYYDSYFCRVDNVNYKITKIDGSNQRLNGFLSIEVEGNPFNNDIVNISKEIYIIPNSKIVDEFKSNADLLTLLLLRDERVDGYYTQFYNDTKDIGGQFLEYTIEFRLPKSDLYNIDITSNYFEIFLDEITKYAAKQDAENSNTIIRKYVSNALTTPILDNLSGIENDSARMESLLQIYGYSFDEQFKLINNLKSIRNISYDEQESQIADEFLDYFANNLGIDISLLDTYEKKRIFLLNSTWLLKTKGTRAAIEYIFLFLGIPLEFITLNEFVNIIEDKIDLTLLLKYYKLIYGNTDISKLSVDEDGFPKINSDYVFEDSNYWDQFQVLDPNLNGKYYAQTNTKYNRAVIYNNEISTSGSTLQYVFSGFCYTLTGSTIVNEKIQNYVDECDCEVEQKDYAYEIIYTPIDLYSGCTMSPVIDVWQSCLADNTVQMNVDIYGGVAPFTYSGLTDTQILSTGQTYSVYVIDNNGCVSNTVTGVTYCYNKACEENPLTTNFYYVCNKDADGIFNGTATVVLQVSGGTLPYTINGHEHGDIVLDGETIVTEVLDYNGCYSGILSHVVDCYHEINCVPLYLNSTAECIANFNGNSRVRLNVTYDLIGIPPYTEIDHVIMGIEQSGSTIIAGNPITEYFTLASGAKTIYVSFAPNPIGTANLNVTLTVVLKNGCEYQTIYPMAVDCTQINLPTNYNETLNAI